MRRVLAVLFVLVTLAALARWTAPPVLAKEPAPTPTVLPVEGQPTAEVPSPYHGTGGPTTRSRVVFGILLMAILAIMSLELVDKSIVTLIGSMVCLGLAYSPWFELLTHRGVNGEAPFYISTIDWSTIGVIIGTSIFVEIASRSGIFTWSALRVTKTSGGDPFKLLLLYSILTVLFSAFLNNVTAMIIVGSLTIVSCKRLELPPLPFLFTEGILTNVGGLLTLISSIPNIIVGNTAGISFVKFFLVAAPYTVLAAGATVFFARWRFSEIRSLTSDKEKMESAERVAEFDESEAVKDRRFFKVAWAGMACVILGFALQSHIPILKDMGLEAVALGAAALFLLLYSPHHVEEAVDTVEWSMVLFFASLFVIIGVMEMAGVLGAIGSALSKLIAFGRMGSSSAIMWSSAAISSVTDNIPLSAMLAKIFSLMKLPANSSLWWSVVFGANLGGNITPIGSASTVVAMTIMKKEKIELGFGQFVKMALPFALLQLVLATIYILILMGLGVTV